ncbi:MAG TPA: hypothetical protein VFZ09_11450 [Archangium sp.]|uniref:hypothetical protein n=1 Tax=Archangium sp. TaxID=1872627 RepID=UPI002E365E85|nr:hypothetical protein [Archangium sp.]HEX5746849.1 hypothetical protein [Archangium sp.]
MTDALLIIDAEVSRASDVLSRVAASLQVTQRLPPRLAIVRGTPGQLEALREQPGVAALCEGPVPPEVLEQLGPTEQLFAKAWETGRQPKSRPGEGLPWDAPGFQPPDGPGKH